MVPITSYIRDSISVLVSFYGHSGLTMKSMFSKPYTIHLWRDLVTKKYKLDTNGKYHPDSLWEKTKGLCR